MSLTSAYKGEDMFYRGLWISGDNWQEYRYFRFAIVKDENTREETIRNIEGKTGDLVIRTKSTIKFQPDDVIKFQGVRYVVLIVDGNRKEADEQAFYKFRQNGNINTYLTLTKMG